MIEVGLLILGLVLGGVVGWFIALQRSSGVEARLDEQATQREALEGALTEARAARSVAEQLAARREAEAEGERRNLEAQRAILADAQAQLTNVFRAIGSQELERIQRTLVEESKSFGAAQRELAKADFDKGHQAIEASLKPVRELLDQQRTALGELDRRNVAAYSSLETQIKGMVLATDAVRTEAGKLSTALRRSDARGRWGETALKNFVEMAGMTEHVDFDTQVYVKGAEGGLLPDLVVRIPGGGTLVVDSKVPLEHYLNAQEGDTAARLLDHATAVRRHVDQLSAKAYWNNFKNSPSYVVMFMPIESALAAAFGANPDLQEHALRSKVIVASSGIFLALLQTVALFWRQEQLAENAREIAEAGANLYERLAKFATHLNKMGDSLGNATKRFNNAVGSFESRVLPSARTLKTLKVSSTAELAPPTQVEIIPRRVATESDDAPIAPDGQLLG